MSKRRKRYSQRPASPKSAPFWQNFLGLPGGAALVTAVLGIVGLVVTAYVNTYFNAATKNAPAERPEAATSRRVTDPYLEYLEAQRNFVFDAAVLVGRCVSSSDDLIALTGPDFDPSRYRGIEPQRLEMRRKFNDCASKWNEEYNKLNIGMSYYHGGQPGVAAAWDGVQQAATGYMNCAQRWYVENNTAPVATSGACRAEKDDMNRRFADFKREVGAATRHAWQQRAAGDAAGAAASGKKPGQVGLVEQ